MPATITRNQQEKTALQGQTGLTTISLHDLRVAFYGPSNSLSQRDSIRAYLQSQLSLTTVQSLNDLWRLFFISKGAVNQSSLTDMAKDFFTNIGFGNTTPTEVVDVSVLTGSAQVGWGDSSTPYRGQGFIPSKTTLTAIAFQMADWGSNNMKVWIDAANSDSTPVSALGSGLYSFVIPNASIALALTKYSLPVPLSGLTAGNRYVIYMSPWTPGGAQANDYHNGIWDNTNPYADGQGIKFESGPTWGLEPGLDLKMQTYGY